MKATTTRKGFPASLSGRRAYTLIEILVVMSVLALLMGLLMMTLFGIIRIEKGSRAALDRLSREALVADQFRDDVTQASATPARWQKETAGPTCLILRMSDGRHVVYLWKDNQLLRSEFSNAGKLVRRHPLANGIGKATFCRMCPSEPMLTLRLVELRERRGKESTLEIAAVLGGERR
jgi:prepilin-type N-terminal cleavage/methylation domain-containing protein